MKIGAELVFSVLCVQWNLEMGQSIKVVRRATRLSATPPA